MQKLLLSVAIVLIMKIPTMASDTTVTITRHDTVFADRLIIDNTDAIKRLTEPYKTTPSPTKKICGWTMIFSGISLGTFSIINYAEGLPMETDEFGELNYRFRKQLRKTGFYEINICLSVGLIAGGASMLFK